MQESSRQIDFLKDQTQPLAINNNCCRYNFLL